MTYHKAIQGERRPGHDSLAPCVGVVVVSGGGCKFVGGRGCASAGGWREGRAWVCNMLLASHHLEHLNFKSGRAPLGCPLVKT